MVQKENLRVYFCIYKVTVCLIDIKHGFASHGVKTSFETCKTEFSMQICDLQVRKLHLMVLFAQACGAFSRLVVLFPLYYLTL